MVGNAGSGRSSAYVSNNPVARGDLADLISAVHGKLEGLIDEPAMPAEKPRPAVPIRKSVTEDHIVCLEDGKKLKMLKRHLRVAYGMSPEEYREKWGLPADYPMVAPSYARTRRELAIRLGLGRKPTTKERGKRRR